MQEDHLALTNDDDMVIRWVILKLYHQLLHFLTQSQHKNSAGKITKNILCSIQHIGVRNEVKHESDSCQQTSTPATQLLQHLLHVGKVSADS